MPPDVTAALRDPARVSALRRLQLLDTPPEDAFDRLTRLASRTLGVPIALVNLIDEDRQFFKSAVGMGEVRELPVGTGVCSYALASREPLVIEDARVDPRFSSNPIVTDFGLVAYIGIPLVTSGGHALGTFCIVDTEPRAWRDEDLETMRDLGGTVMTEVDLRLLALELEQKAEEAEAAHAVADAAHHKVQELVEGLDAIVWEADADTWHFSFVSRRAEDVLGYPVEQWVAEPGFWRTFIHPDDQERVAGLCRAATAAGRDHEVEYRAVAADGRTVWIRDLVRVFRDGEGRPHRLRGVMTDVTARKEMESALAETGARYRSLAEDALGTSEVGTFILDADFRVAWASQAIERLFGLERGEAIGADKRRLVRERVAPMIEDGDRFAEQVLRTYDDNSTVAEFECRVRAAGEDRPERWLAHWSQPIRRGLYAGGRIEHYYDVTERKRTEEALRAAKEEAERANRSKTEFLSAMSHELRTPLNAIAGYLDLIDLGVHGPVTDAQSEALARIKRNQEHLLTLINDILHYARIEAGRTEFQTAVAPVGGMLAAIEALIEPQARARGVAYTCRRPGPGVWALCDPDRVQQVLLNLVGNAIKFTDPGGWVMLSCDGDEQRVRVRVSDNGRGIPPERLGSVFDPFVQLERHRNETSQQGVGLGLAISRDLARGMGGDLTVESAPGHGSTFTLVLPRGTPGPEGRAAPP